MSEVKLNMIDGTTELVKLSISKEELAELLLGEESEFAGHKFIAFANNERLTVGVEVVVE